MSRMDSVLFYICLVRGIHVAYGHWTVRSVLVIFRQLLKLFFGHGRVPLS